MPQPDNTPELFLPIGTKVSLPKLIESRALIMASSGGGKSYLMRKIMEEAAEKKVQQIIIDPEGEFVTLREKYDFALIAKEDGDIPLNIKYAETLAHKILETGISAIIDLYELDKNEQQLFVKKFFTALEKAPKHLWRNLLLYLDESHDFAPQGKESESTKAVISLCSKGRKRGYGIILATQRISKLHKDATADLYNKFIGATVQDVDRKRAGEELGFYNKVDIRNLQFLQEEFHAFGPAIGREVIKFKASSVKTTHLKSGVRLTTVPPTPKAIQNILSQLKDIPEEAEKELATKQQMEKEIGRLKTELAAARRLNTLESKSETTNVNLKNYVNKDDHGKKVNELTILIKNRDEIIKTQSKNITTLQKHIETLKAENTKLIDSFSSALDNFSLSFDNISSNYNKKTDKEISLSTLPEVNNRAPTTNHSAHTEKNLPKRIEKQASENNSTLPNGELKVLTVCAQKDNGATKTQIILLTGYKGASVKTYLQRLVAKGLIVRNADRFEATGEASYYLGADFEPLPTGQDLRDYWLANLPEGERKILAVLLTAYPASLTRNEITDDTDYSPASVKTYLQRLSAKELIIINKTSVTASEILFQS